MNYRTVGEPVASKPPARSNRSCWGGPASLRRFVLTLLLGAAGPKSDPIARLSATAHAHFWIPGASLATLPMVPMKLWPLHARR